MPQSLAPIPPNIAITDKDGLITSFFRFRWQQLISGFQLTPDVASISLKALSAALGLTNAFVSTQSGLYRLQYYLRVMSPDGVSSSVQLTIGWTESGYGLTLAEPALTSDSINLPQVGIVLLPLDAASPLTIQTAYSSNTPNKMLYELLLTVEQMG